MTQRDGLEQNMSVYENEKSTPAVIEKQKTEEKPYPGFLQAGLLLIIYHTVVFCLMMFVILFATMTKTLVHMDPVVRMIAYMGALVLVLAYGIEKSKKGLTQIFSFKAIRLSLLLPFIITLIGMHIILSGLNNYVISMVPGSEAAEKYIVDFLHKDSYAFIFFAIIFGPFFEELMFRGLIVSGFRKRYRVNKTMVLSALLFAAYHGNALQFMPSFFVGIILAWWFINTRSLLSVMFGHAISNAIVILTPLFIIAYFPQVEGVQQWPLWLYLLGITLLLVGIWLSARLFKNHRVADEQH
jgi:membrane protease YdiL (CAAX protease family)